jgi:hypothetical protein
MIGTHRYLTPVLVAIFLAGNIPSVAADPSVWCEYEELGHMLPGTLIVIHTNGLFRVWEGARYPERKRPTQWFYEECLTSEDQRFLGMWFAINDCMNRPQNRERSDAERELRLHGGGKTNVVCFGVSNEAELGQIDFFFHVLESRARGNKSPSTGKLVTTKGALRALSIPKERPVALLRSYIGKATDRPDLVSEALRFLSHLVTAEEWGGFVSERLRAADGAKRALLLQALTASDYGLQTRIPEEHLHALRPLLDNHESSPEAK